MLLDLTHAITETADDIGQQQEQADDREQGQRHNRYAPSGLCPNSRMVFS